MSGATQSVVDQLTNRALHDAALRGKDAETYVKKYMKVALCLFKEEIPHTTKIEKLLDLICSMESDICHFAQTRDKNATYRSTTTTSEFMHLMDNILDDEVSIRLRCSINEYGAYTIMADETSINNNSFLRVYARFLEELDGREKRLKNFFSSLP